MKKKKRLPYGPVNVELFQQIKEKILADPKHFDMHGWGTHKPKCGTVCCIGGWAEALVYLQTHKTIRGMVTSDFVYNNSTDFLHLVSRCGSTEKRDAVFHISRWPKLFRTMYFNALTGQAKAQVAAKYIDWICGKAS